MRCLKAFPWVSLLLILRTVAIAAVVFYALQPVFAVTQLNPPEVASVEQRGEVLASLQLWMDRLREGEFHPQENAAVRLSPFCPPKRADEYRNQHAEFASEYLDEEAYSLDEEEQAVWQSGDFAASMLVFRDRVFPINLKVVPVCLLRINGQWQVAAGIRHYQNTHFGFQQDRWDASENLSRWVETAAKAMQETLETEELSALRKEVSRLQAERRDAKLDGEAFLMAYLDAENNGSQIERLSFLYLPEVLEPGEINEVIATFESNPAREIILLENFTEQSREGGEPVVSQLVASKKEGNQIGHVLGYFYPEEPTNSHVVVYYIIRIEDDWRVISDHPQMQNMLPSTHQVVGELIEWFDENEFEFIGEFIARIIRQSAGELVGLESLQGPLVSSRTFLESIAAGNYYTAMGYLYVPEGVEYEYYDSCMQWLDSIGRRLRTQNIANVLSPLEEKADGGIAIVFFQSFSPLRPEEQQILSVYTLEVEGVWQVVHEPARLSRDVKELAAGIREGVVGLMQVEAQRRGELLRIARTGLLDGLPGLLPVGERPDPDKLEIAEVVLAVEGYLDAAREGSFMDMLRYSASFEELRPGEIISSLESLGFALREMHGVDRRVELLGVERSGHWAGVALRIRHTDGAAPQEKMRLLVWTDEGWKVLVQGEFFREINRGYRRLNQESDAFLQRHLEEADMEEVKSLRVWHTALSVVAEDSENPNGDGEP